MKKIIFIVLVSVSAAAFGQKSLNVGYGMSLPYFTQQAHIGYGARIGPLLYVEGQGRGYHKYCYASVGAIIGAAQSWNNNARHELTTMIYFKHDWVLAADQSYKDKPPTPFGLGIRHYVYNFMIDGLYQHKQFTVTLGWSFKSMYK